jgi:hypothetical protein
MAPSDQSTRCARSNYNDGCSFTNDGSGGLTVDQRSLTPSAGLKKPASPVGIFSIKSVAPSLCCNCQCGKHNYHKINNTYANKEDTTVYVVHPNVGLRPPSIGIGHLIIQLMEITDRLTPLRHTLSLYGHTNL